MARGDLGGDPAADAVADEVELVELQGVEDFEIVKDHVFDDIDVFVLVALGAAGMGRRDDASAFRQLFVKRQPDFL